MTDLEEERLAARVEQITAWKKEAEIALADYRRSKAKFKIGDTVWVSAPTSVIPEATTRAIVIGVGTGLYSGEVDLRYTIVPYHRRCLDHGDDMFTMDRETGVLFSIKESQLSEERP